MRPGAHPSLFLLILAALGCVAVAVGVTWVARSGSGDLLPGMRGSGYAALDRPQTQDEAHALAQVRGGRVSEGRILGRDDAGRRYVIQRARDQVCLYVVQGETEAGGRCGPGDRVRRDGLWHKLDLDGAAWLVVLTPDSLRDASIDAAAPPRWRNPNLAVFASQRDAGERVRFYKRGGGEVIIRTPDQP